MSDFIGSDFHFSHVNIIQHCNRPFADVSHMNEVLFTNWNNKVSDADTVYVVGDMFMGQKEHWPKLRERLNGRIILVMGNHDGKAKLSRAENHAFMRSCGIEETTEELYYRDENHGVTYWMNHYPPAGFDRARDERGYERPPASQPYDILIHGHIHSKNIYTSKNVIHVGIDALNYQPISFDELFDIVQNQPCLQK